MPETGTTTTNNTISTSCSPDDNSISIKALEDFPNEAFFQHVTIYPAISVPVKRTANLRKLLKHVVLRRPQTKNVFEVEGRPDQRVMLLHKNDDDDDAKVFDDPKVAALLQEHVDCQRTTYNMTMSYQDLTVDEILRRLLPASITEIPAAYEQVGCLAHINLREQVLPYKYWIGKVLLDKNQPRVKTVVNKLSSIDTKFRTFGMEVIAGSDAEGWSQVTLKEEGCIFDLDFRQVYWNSRLAGEHHRLVQLIKNQAKRSENGETVVADLMAGVGPFAVPLTRPADNKPNKQQKEAPGRITVYANDLNPASFKYLAINDTKNKCRNLHCYNVDARAFVHQLEAQQTEIDHVIMNLPATAPDFLDAFRGYTGKKLPLIHVHCFAPKASESQDYQDAVDRCATALGCPLDRKADRVQVHVVRDVSPNKNMLCVSFTLPQQARSLERLSIEPPCDAEEPDAKRPKQATASTTD